MKTLRATIDLVRGAKGRQGRIKTVMILGDDVVNKTMPAILCDEDLTLCWVTTALPSDPSPEQPDYLAARGLHQAAEQMFIRALLKTPSPTRLRRFPTGCCCEAELAQKSPTTMTDL